MKHGIILAGILIFHTLAYAQENSTKTKKYYDGVKLKYHVLKSNPDIKNGLFQALNDRNHAVASGMYANNKKVGLWHYFNHEGTLLQNFNYDTNMLMYEAPDSVSFLKFAYSFDKHFTGDDKVTKPMKIGGRYYGYLPYLKLYQRPKQLDTDNPNYIVYKLLISPFGKLADIKLTVGDLDLNMNLDLLNEEDKQFIPATVNGEPAASTIIITCQLAPWNHPKIY